MSPWATMLEPFQLQCLQEDSSAGAYEFYLPQTTLVSVCYTFCMPCLHNCMILPCVFHPLLAV